MARPDDKAPASSPRKVPTSSYDEPNVHRLMMEDRVRTEAYGRAISEVVRPGDRVLDFGCGVGILSLFAARAGAARVYAMDRSHIIRAAEEVARDNGIDTIRFLPGDAWDIELPEQVDVLMHEGLGHFAFYETMIQLVPTLRDRWLAPGGRMIPARMSLHAAFFTDEELHTEFGYWRHRPYGFDFSFMGDWGYNRTYLQRLTPEQVYGATVDLGVYDFAADGALPRRLAGSLIPTATSITHGLAGWFDLELSRDASFGTGPHSPRTHWSQVLFPFAEPFPLSPGREVQVVIEPIEQSDAGGTLWRWSASDGTNRRDGDDFVHQAWLNRTDPSA